MTTKEQSERIEKLERILDQLYDDFFAITERKNLSESEFTELQRSAAWEAIQSYDVIRKVKINV